MTNTAKSAPTGREMLAHFGQSVAKWFTLAGVFVVLCKYSSPFAPSILTLFS